MKVGNAESLFKVKDKQALVVAYGTGSYGIYNGIELVALKTMFPNKIIYIWNDAAKWWVKA